MTWAAGFALLRRFWWAVPMIGLLIALHFTRETLADRTATLKSERAAWTAEIAKAEQLRAAGFHIAALALSDRAESLDEFAAHVPDRVAIVLGTEGDGLSVAALDAADTVVTIPMMHGVDSLNVASASAVALYALRVR